MSNHILPEDLSAYLDGESPDPDSIKRHLQGCAACARAHMQLAKLSAHLQSLPEPAISSDFAARVMAAVEASKPEGRIIRIRWTRVAAQVAVAAGLLLGVATFVPYKAEAPSPGDVATAVALPSVPLDIETPYAEAGDTSWLFAGNAGEHSEPVAESEEVLMALADIRIFDKAPTSPRGDYDPQSAVGNMNETATETLVVLLSDYAKEEVTQAW